MSELIADILSLEIYLDRMSQLTQEDIQNIWRRSIELEIKDLNTLKYNYDIPLFQKMIFRFRNCERSPSMLYNQIDPINKQKLLWYIINDIFNQNKTKPPLTYTDVSIFKKVIEFFIWIKSAFSWYILKADFPSLSEHHLQLWNQNEIKFFFGLDNGIQLKLINMYNEYIVFNLNI